MEKGPHWGLVVVVVLSSACLAQAVLTPGVESAPGPRAGNGDLPGKATLISPQDSISSLMPTYLWNAVSNSTCYGLYVQDSAVNPKINKWYTAREVGCASGTGTCSVTPTITLAVGNCKWWVRTWNDTGYGDWSDGMAFSVGSAGPPGKATLVSPLGAVSTALPTYIWNAISNSSWYGLYIQDSAANPKVNKWYTAAETGCASGTGTCSVTPTIALAVGNCKWWIQTWNESGYGDWSDGMAFSVGSALPPGKATLVSPQGTISSANPSYKWSAVSNSTWYGLYVQDSAANPRINKWYTASDAGCAAGAGTCSVTPTTALTAGDARWWVQTWNEAGYGSWSDGMSFRVELGKAILISPQGAITTANPTYIWNAVPSTTSYGLYVQDTAANPKITKWYTPAEAGCAAGTGTCSVTPGIKLALGASKWWVQVYNSTGYGPWSDGMDLTVSPSSAGPSGIEFVTVPAGEFQMGQIVGPGWDEVPIHRAVISQPFEMGKYEITQAQYLSVMSPNPSYHKGGDLPVEAVSWSNAKAFVNALNFLNDGYTYRLPTEAEWEYAARAGTIGRWPYNLNEVAWHSGNSGGTTHPVGTRKPNPFGLHDMLGNVQEWVLDWYDVNYYQYCVDNAILTDPPGAASGTDKVHRGGDYDSGHNYIYLGYRSADSTEFSGTSEKRGFRIARTKLGSSGYPVIVAAPYAVEFGGVSAGASSDEQVMIKNGGNANLTIGTITSPAPPFDKVTDDCSGKTLSPGETCTVTYRFAPSSAGTFDGTSSIPSNDTGRNPLAITLNGTVTSDIVGLYGIRFVTVPAGEFQMGQKDVGPGWDEVPVHRVVISKSFEMGIYEITQKQFSDVTGFNPSYETGDNLPVEMTSWDDAQAFIDALNSREDGYNYRLPTEAEWEYACRAGATGNNPFNLDEVAWYGGNSGNTTHPVGTKKPNPFGLYDMLGNADEWVQDWYDDNYYQYCLDKGIVIDPQGPASGTEKGNRGGNYNSNGFYIMPGHRGSDATGFSGTSEKRGFRIVRTGRIGK